MKNIINYLLLLFFVTITVYSTAQTINYEYDNLSRLTQVKYENGTTILYQYDQVGNRTFKILNGVEQVNLAPPLELSAIVTNDNVELNWSAPDNKSLTGYNVFRDGNKIASEISLTTYTDFDLPEGTYQYCVNAVYDSVESSKICVPATIDLTEPLVAEFSGAPLQGLAPLEVVFTDLSTGEPVSWQWEFGDGSVSSLQNPLHTYLESGSYTVKLIVSNSSGSSTVSKQNYIQTNINSKPVITSVDDVPNDQGGWVYVNFLRTFYDTDSLQKSEEMYNIELNIGNGWVVTETIGAYGASSYSVLCHTPIDSSQFSNGIIDFRVIGIMEEGNFVSEIVEGYSVDNIAPSVPENLSYEFLDGIFQLSWNSCPDFDFAYFSVYKNDVSGGFSSSPIATSTTPGFADQLAPGEIAYYVVTATDYHGNESAYSEEIETVPTMRWELKEGWSGISSFIEPSENDIENMFSDIQPQLILLQNDNGMYWPGQNINTLGNWDMQTGYKVKVTEDVNLSISGSRIENQNLSMAQSWNLMPVLSECPADVAELFSGNDLEIVKEVAGWRVYWPEFGINTLEALQPGKSYFALMENGGEIEFPECAPSNSPSGGRTGILENGTKSQWAGAPFPSRGRAGDGVFTPTPISHNIALPVSANTNGILQSGDILGVFDANGNCFGLAEWNGANTAITVFGDDPLTTEKDGFTPGETMYLRSYNPESEIETELEVIYNFTLPQQGLFAENGLSAISGIKSGSTGIENKGQVQQIQIIPNPAKDAFTLYLDFDPQQAGLLELYNLKGQLMKQVEIHDKTTKVEIADLPAGVYVAKILIDHQTMVKQLVKH